MNEIQSIKTRLQMSKLLSQLTAKVGVPRDEQLIAAYTSAREEFDECEADVDAEISLIMKLTCSATSCAASVKERMCRRIADSKIETLGQRLGDAIAALVKAQNAIAEA